MIRINRVSKFFGSVEAVSDLSLDIQPGECFGFLGPNGAGKTTTIKMIAGLLIPSQGEIEICGHSIQRAPVDAKRVTGFIPDKAYVYEKLTGKEYIDFVLDLYEINGDRAREKREYLLDLFSLKAWENELVESYSHGMRQKLVITSVLLHEPKVIVIDEPMVGLDPKGARQVKDLLSQATQNGTTIFLSTHTLSIAQEICNRIGIIHNGKLIALGTMNELNEKAHTQAQQLEQIFLQLTEEENPPTENDSL